MKAEKVQEKLEKHLTKCETCQTYGVDSVEACEQGQRLYQLTLD